MGPGAGAQLARILLIEDDEDDFVLVRDLLQSARAHRYALDWVPTAAAAASAMASGGHDVCLVDYRLGERNGIDLVKAARERGDCRPLILLTGQGDDSVDIEAMQAGASDYLVKGQLTTDLLERTVRYAVEHSRAEEGRRRLASILEATTDFVATLTLEGQPLYVNRAGCAMLGLNTPLDASKSLEDLFAAETVERLRDTAIPATCVAGTWRGEGIVCGPNRLEIPASFVIIGHQGGPGTAPYLSIIARDISEIRRQQAKILRLSRIQAVLSGINGTIVRATDRQRLFDESCRLAVTHGGFRLAVIGLVDAEGTLVPAAHAGIAESLLDAVQLTVREDLPGGRGLTGQALRSGEPVICNDIETDPRFVVERERQLALGIRSVVALPLVVGRAAVGCLLLFGGEKNLFDDDEMRLLREVAGDIAFSLDHLGKVEELATIAYGDQLTGLPNRALFSDRLGQLLVVARPLAVVVCDIDRLRNINDTFGQVFGDEVLRTLGQRLIEAAPPGATVARLGTDDFGVILPDAEHVAEVRALLADRMLPAVGRPIGFQGNEVRLSVRFGIAVAPNDGAVADALLGNAEAALRRAVDTGERFLFYEPQMNARVAERLTLQTRLLQAIEGEQFRLFYQPKLDLKSNTVVGFEALIRWKDPERGMVSPAEFVPLLEETGLIVEAGRWVLRQAIADRMAWIAAGHPPVPVAVNVSAVQLRQPGFVDDVRAAMAACDSPDAIAIEITESLFLEDHEGAISKLNAVRELCAGVCIDDCCTGYSSLRYIARLPVDTLKIDRSFISLIDSSPDNMAIVSAVISLAHALDLRVVAEGVETREQLNLLRLLKCDEIQGYILSRPVPADDAVSLLHAERIQL